MPSQPQTEKPITTKVKENPMLGAKTAGVFEFEQMNAELNAMEDTLKTLRTFPASEIWTNWKTLQKLPPSEQRDDAKEAAINKLNEIRKILAISTEQIKKEIEFYLAELELEK